MKTQLDLLILVRWSTARWNIPNMLALFSILQQAFCSSYYHSATVLPKIQYFQVQFQLRPFCVKFPCPPSANSCDVVDFHSPNPCMWSWLEACSHGMSMGTGSCPWWCPSCPQEPAGQDPSSLNGNKRTDGTTSVNPSLIVTLQEPTVWPTREISSVRLPGMRIAEWPRVTPLSTSTKESCLPANRWLLVSAAIYVSAQWHVNMRQGNRS